MLGRKMHYIYILLVVAVTASVAIVPNILARQENPLGLQSKPNTDHFCHEIKFMWCAHRFADDVGARLTKNATEFALELQNRYLAGNLSLSQTCFSVYRYEGCLGDHEGSCLSQDNLRLLGLSPTDALVYHVIGKQLGVECAPDVFPILLKNEECIANVSKTKLDKAKQCALNFSAELVKDPDHVCKYAKDYENCISELYANCSKDAEYAVCRIFDSMTGLTFPQCKDQLKCTRPGAEEMKPGIMLSLNPFE